MMIQYVSFDKYVMFVYQYIVWMMIVVQWMLRVQIDRVDVLVRVDHTVSLHQRGEQIHDQQPRKIHITSSYDIDTCTA